VAAQTRARKGGQAGKQSLGNKDWSLRIEVRFPQKIGQPLGCGNDP
jgi:hypothetical protein